MAWRLLTDGVGTILRGLASGHSTRTGRPKHGASAAATCRRPCPAATTPQTGQPVVLSVVSTSSSNSPPYSAPASTTNPAKPSDTAAVSITRSGSGMTVGFPFTRGLHSVSPRTTDHEAPGLSPASGWDRVATSATTLHVEEPLYGRLRGRWQARSKRVLAGAIPHFSSMPVAGT